MKLSSANLCISCDEIFEGQQCPCTSRVYLPLTRIIKPLDLKVVFGPPYIEYDPKMGIPKMGIPKE